MQIKFAILFKPNIPLHIQCLKCSQNKFMIHKLCWALLPIWLSKRDYHNNFIFIFFFSLSICVFIVYNSFMISLLCSERVEKRKIYVMNQSEWIPWAGGKIARAWKSFFLWKIYDFHSHRAIFASNDVHVVIFVFFLVCDNGAQ